jgi:signal transduction histidine kinase
MKTRVEIAAALAAGSLHELRNLLAIVASSAYLAKQKQGEPQALSAQLDKLEGQVERARGLVERLLAVASGGALEVEAVPVRALFDEATRDLERPANVSVEVDAAPGLEVRCERTLLSRALGNLIGNAVEAVTGAGGGRVVMAATRTEAALEIAVSDDGPGFSGQPFDGATTKPAGVGLGLLTARGIVEAHGGALVAEEAARGARLVLRLPAG